MAKYLNQLTLMTAILFGSSPLWAELQPIDDEDLSEYVGQASVAFDISEIAGNSYTRITLGMEAKLQMNIDSVELGNYNSAGETLAADFSATNLAFGSISTDASKIQLDGQTYSANDIVPFELNDPFFEIAQNGSDELMGFRLGFGQARGQLSGDFTSMKGNIGVDITDYFGDDYRSVLLNENAEKGGRSQYFGVDKDLVGVTDCNSGFYCYNLADYKTLDVGQRNYSTGEVEHTQDFFISFQKESTQWLTTDGVIDAGLGVHINIPTSMHIDMNTGTNANGTERVRVEYINRGNGLF